MFGDNPVEGRKPIGTIVTRRTIAIESQAAPLITRRIFITLQSFTSAQRLNSFRNKLCDFGNWSLSIWVGHTPSTSK